MEDIKKKLERMLAAGNWSAEEKVWLLEYLETANTAELQQIMQMQFRKNITSVKDISDQQAQKILKLIHQRIKASLKKPKIFSISNWKKLAVAASVIGIIAFSAYLLLSRNEEEKIAKTDTNKQFIDINPGGNKAILTMADGSTIILDNAANGIIRTEGGAEILKLENGKLAYNSKGSSDEILYNTIATPRGGQYQLTLSDGSKIWLNAASSIRYPAVFTGNERKVEVTGEAYFEVAKNNEKPFRVGVNNTVVEVLGTSFNINAYSDEETLNTTLLEGSVKLSNANDVHTLSPGQQAIVNSNGQIEVNHNVNVNNVVAWKNGVFDFNRVDIKTVMRQISRWYDVDVVYKGAISKETFSGIVNRNSEVKVILKIMEGAGISFSAEGKTIIVK